MKRKFSFNLAPVKVPSKSDSSTKVTPDPSPSHHRHYRHESKDSLSAPNTPFINRRPLSPKTEQELRSACAFILQDFKPSGHMFDDPAKPKLDFQCPNRRRDMHRSDSTQVKVHRPTGAPAKPRSAYDPRKNRHKIDPFVKGYPDLPMQANVGRRRGDQQPDVADKEYATKRTVKSPCSDNPRSATIRTEMDYDDATSLQTPLTASTENHLNNGSTAPTSAALTSSRSSKRASRQLDNAAAIADAQAAEWMRQEVEKRRQQLPAQPEPKTPAQAPSRSRSIRSEIKEYIFPGSTTLSRAQSSESMRSQDSGSQSKRSGSSQGWRSWGLQRKLSSRSNSRPGTSKGRIETRDHEKKPEVNLNRELPPLPSLDSWNKQEQRQENRKSQGNGAHIATVMRSQDHQQQEYAAAVRRHHRRSGSDTLALRYASSTFPQPAAHITRATSHAEKVPVAPQKRSPNPRQDSSMDFDELMSAMDSSRTFDDQQKLKVNGHARHHSTSSDSRPLSMKISMDHGRLDPPPNFSRKISTDVTTSNPNYEHDLAYPNVVQIKPHAEAQKDEKSSKLRKVFSSWMLKKEKKGNWMDQFEKDGVKGGIMIQDEAALPPVVRY
ncbi:hypothetical protein K469DRAFT_269030 [Zopfia rhizophila CBS 207.26]|uniref:Uncharacterized protein n=1 Tax=Zopfia rhizophila CBS 207.26 TaxID=1314779 RepID=A0A6A6DMD7_9PEZI|nr:hypothetical protein K469DRAFT_269030 [Zopfia rhizophila CBS 207.26]